MTDIEIAKSYLSKAQGTEDRGIEFKLSFAEYKRLITKTKCHYTGMDIFTSENNKQQLNTKTIDRIDSSIGYTKDNCVICSHYFNRLKSSLENDNNVVGFKHLFKGVNKLQKELKNAQL